MTMLPPILASAPAPPQFRLARVVMPPPGESLDTRIEFADARRDGSAVGVTSGRMVNSQQTNAIYVLAGHWWPVEDARTKAGTHLWEPYAILDRRTVAMTFSTGLAVSPIETRSQPRVFHPVRVPRLASVDQSRFLKRPARAPRLDLAESIQRDPVRIPFFKTWWTPHLRGTPTDRGVDVVWTTTRFGYAVGDAELDTPTEDRSDLDPRYVPMLRWNGGTKPLRDAVVGHPELGGLAWLSPEGWIIATVWKGDRRGLAWLEPLSR